MSAELKDHYWQMKPNKPLAVQLAKRQLSEFVFDAVNLEGINYSLPEIQTLLDGVTVGGHKLSDQNIVLNQAAAWKKLFKLVEQDSFKLSVNLACELHGLAGKEEALFWGKFRNAGVTIAGTDYNPPDYKQLPDLFNQMKKRADEISDVYERSFFVFLSMSHHQFFFDVNKRMGRFMMNGMLLNEGYPAINVQAKRQKEFNQNMLDFYNSGEFKTMYKFLRSCMDHKVLTIMKESQGVEFGR